MLPVVLFGALGVSGVFYLFMNYFWPGWYLDFVYRRAYRKSGAAIADRVARKQLLIDIFEEVAARIPKKAFIIYEDKKFSYEYMDKKANQVARAMVEIGVRPGATVAVLIYNEPAIVWTYLGLMKAGYQIAFINFNLRSRSLAHCIKSSGANVLLIGEGEELVAAVGDVMLEIPGVTVYLKGATSEQKPPKFLSFELVMSRMSPKHVDRVTRKHVNLMTTNVYIYTSGTTGLPKPAIVSQMRCLTASQAFNIFDFSEDDVLYESLPLYHSAALMVGFGSTVAHGATMILRDKFSASNFWKDCRKHNATVIQYIGEMCRYLLAKPKSKLDGVHSIKHAYGNGSRQGMWQEFQNRFRIPNVVKLYDATECPIGAINVNNQVGEFGKSSPYMSKLDGVHSIKHAYGNGLRQDIWLEFQNRFRIPKIIEFYGATECPITFKNVNNRVGACGRSSPYMRKFTPCAFVKFDLESQSPERNNQGWCIPIGPNEVGLLIVPIIPGRTSFNGYKGKASDTEKKLLHDVFEKGDKYFNTGDMLRVDGNYYLYFNDRVGDTFRWKGENVSTTEVSNILTDLDFIQDASVYGVTIPGTDGRAGMAALTLTEDSATLTPAMLTALSNHVTKVLPFYAQPKFIRVKTSFDMTSTYKHQKITFVNEGFDITKVSDPMFYLNPSVHIYLPLDQGVYSQIMTKTLSF